MRTNTRAFDFILAFLIAGVLAMLAHQLASLGTTIVASLATLPVFIRLPRSPWVRLEDGRRVPEFVSLDVREIVAFSAGPADDQGRSTTNVILRNGSRTLLSTFEDEFAYILSEYLGAIQIDGYDYRQHTDQLAAFREKISIRASDSTNNNPNRRDGKTATEHAAAGSEVPF